jgi:alcohol dehydrogenase (NADP+)
MQLNYLLVSFLATTTSLARSQIQKPILNPQNTISQPPIGFGTWNLKETPENTTAAVSIAIQTGYRQIDCAAIYGNEKAVGKGIADGLVKANLSRSDIWVTSKLWNSQ